MRILAKPTTAACKLGSVAAIAQPAAASLQAASSVAACRQVGPVDRQLAERKQLAEAVRKRPTTAYLI